MTVLGTRPEIIRLSRIIPRLDAAATSHVLVHTGQNFDRSLSDVFFEELGVRAPDEFLGVRAPSFGAQIGQILEAGERVLLQHRPDRLLVLGDTNSALVSLVARRLGVPVYHMEAGNRCFDDRVPEEVNRRVVDHCSTVLMPYTHRSKENLVREGIPNERIFVTGNPIKEVLDHNGPSIAKSGALARLEVGAGRYFLATMHRAENVDRESRLRSLVDALRRLQERFSFPVVCSVHPRTAQKINAFGIDISGQGMLMLPPMGFFDFVRLERDAFCVLSDSGTVQEEACLFGVPNVTIRDVTERPETIECGSNVLGGVDPDTITQLVEMITERRAAWTPPEEYLATNVSDVVCRLVLGYREPDLAEQEWQRGCIPPA
jgi:UDP-N-acetylglucosamine 2-epimerase (non-hydrolysing)